MIEDEKSTIKKSQTKTVIIVLSIFIVLLLTISAYKSRKPKLVRVPPQIESFVLDKFYTNSETELMKVPNGRKSLRVYWQNKPSVVWVIGEIDMTKMNPEYRAKKWKVTGVIWHKTNVTFNDMEEY